MKFTKSIPLKGELRVPGDKSISHRGVILGSLAQGTTAVTNFLEGADCLSTINCFRSMGIDISRTEKEILIHGKGLHGLSAPSSCLDVGNSGTTMRLLSGILAGQRFSSELTGDASIRKRPMTRVIAPLSLMGGCVESLSGNGLAPLRITGRPLKGMHYQSPVSSAQVKSCVLLAGLYADGQTSVTEPFLSRNHSELMLRSFGAKISSKGTTATVEPEPILIGQKVEVPGDISSAAYFIAAALLIPGSELLIQNVGINPTRDGILKVCASMGAKIEILNSHTCCGEEVADLLVRHSSLKGTVIEGALIPTLIDELPVLSVLAAFAEGTTIIRDAQELKVKESNRLDIMVHHLTAMGADVEPTEDGMIITGGKPLHGGVLDSYLDHRIAMAFAVAGMAAEGETEITRADCVDISYPDFYKDLEKLKK